MAFGKKVKWRERVFTFIRSERGNLESSLVLFPLLFLFLCSFQIISAIYIRNGEQLSVQSEASVRSISGEIASGDQVIKLGNSAGRFVPRILLTQRRRSIPTLIPGLTSLLGRELSTSIKGVAVIEPN